MTSLPRSTPTAQQVDPAGILAFLDAVAGTDMHSLLVVRHGNVVAEGWWRPYTADGIQLVYSLSKSFTSTAVGFAVTEGKLDPDDLVLDHLSAIDAAAVDPSYRQLRVHHLLSMSTGHRQDTLERALRLAMDSARRGDPQGPDLVRAFFQVPPDQEPGTVFAYNNTATFLAGVIVQQLTGQRLVDYLRPRLFDPLGVGEVRWAPDPLGRDLGFSGIHVTTETIAALGQLYLRQGRWADRQLLPESWIDRATTLQTPTDQPLPGEERAPDWRRGYGYQFWMSSVGYRGDGAFGQFCLVLPEQDAVVAITSATLNMQQILDAVWAHLLPALGSAAPDAGREDELAERLAGLQVRAVPGAGAGAGVAASGPPTRFARDPADVAGAATWPPTEVHPAVTADLDAVTVRADGAAWALDLSHAGTSTPLGCGDRSWVVGELPGKAGTTVPVAVRGGWVDRGAFGADVVVLQTPHRFSLRCDTTTNTCTARWEVPPLESPDPWALGVR